jgi:2-dehydropantoate 2-reductase
MTDRDIVIYGAGSVGSSIGGWLAPRCPNLSILTRGRHAAAVREKGLAVSLKGEKKPATPVPVNVITDMSERPNAEIVILTVKNYDLDAAAREVKKKLKHEPLIVALQNGLENQKILPTFFKRVIYGVICYSSWRQDPGTVRASRKGPILLGTPNNDPALSDDLEKIREVFSYGFEARVTDDLVNAAVTKMILNLSNATLTLVGHGERPIRSVRTLKHIMIGSMLEGFDIARRSGFKEVPIPGAPASRVLRISAALPEFLSDVMFRGNLASVDINSMGQDILKSGRDRTELESLTGYFIGLADRLKMPAPYNRTVYDLCRKRFAVKPFVPMDETEVWKEIEKRFGT